MARTYRDAYGVPHVRASSVSDLGRGQGEVTARDRTWQLEWLRLRALGQTAGVVGGELAEAWDQFATRMRVVETAQRALAACTGETQAFLASYVEGVNAGLASVPPESVPELGALSGSRGGHRPGAWEPWTPLATFLAQHVLFGSIGTQLWNGIATSVLGEDARLLSHEGPQVAGSNAWAVGGGRTASGLPLIGGDPHRNLEQPGVYQQVRLCVEGVDDAFDVVGFSFVGVPGIQHFGHAGEVAWGITNAAADYQDVVEDGELVLSDLVAVRTSSWVLGDLGFDALLPLLRARSADDVDRALDHWVEPVNNVLIADRAGAVRYRLAGKVPVRDATGEWTGWLEDCHRLDVGPEGELVTANERRGPESAAVGSAFAPPFRAERIRELLEGRSGLTTVDFEEIHNDALLKSFAVVSRLVPGAFDRFDGVMAADSAPAARYAAWRSALVRRIAAEPVLAPLFDLPAEHRHGPLFALTLEPTARIGLALPTLAAEALAGRAPYGIDVVGHAESALEEIDAAQLPATWGQTHVATLLHPLGEPLGFDAGIPALPVSGDQDVVRTMGSWPAVTDAATRGAVARYVWDLADREAGGWVVPTGAAGAPGEHHADQLEPWIEGRLVPIVTDWQRLVEEPDGASTAEQRAPAGER
ncbi:MAG TPA: penicillin acylase family protein [Nocardioides sp.]|nr:penicillin acylase family protein [Nocardioides sp.]